MAIVLASARGRRAAAATRPPASRNKNCRAVIVAAKQTAGGEDRRPTILVIDGFFCGSYIGCKARRKRSARDARPPQCHPAELSNTLRRAALF
jgi:hypothetical protein